MLKEFPVRVTIDKIDKEEFCEILDIRSENGELVNGIGHDNIVDLVKKLCGVELKQSGIEIKMNEGDIALVIMISRRLEEGKVLNEEEIMRMLSEGKISFYDVIL